MVFLTELATNATKNDVKIVLYSANNDALIAHLGTESKRFNPLAVLQLTSCLKLRSRTPLSEVSKVLQGSHPHHGMMTTVILLVLCIKNVAGHTFSSLTLGIWCRPISQKL
jgi:hypothetical protein